MSSANEAGTVFGTRIATFSGMEILRSLGQISLMFLGAFLIVIAVAAAWAVTRARSQRVRTP
jgi:hypothetical protein